MTEQMSEVSITYNESQNTEVLVIEQIAKKLEKQNAIKQKIEQDQKISNKSYNNAWYKDTDLNFRISWLSTKSILNQPTITNQVNKLNQTLSEENKINNSYRISEKYLENEKFKQGFEEKSNQISDAQIDKIFDNNPNISDKEKQQAKQILIFWATINDPKNIELKNQLIVNGEYDKFMDWYNSIDQNHIFLAPNIEQYKNSPSAEKFITSNEKQSNFIDLWLDFPKQQKLKEIYLDANQNLFPIPKQFWEKWLDFEFYKNVIINKDNFRQIQQNSEQWREKLKIVLDMLNSPQIHKAHSDMINLISTLDLSTNQSHKIYALTSMKTMLSSSIAWDFSINEIVDKENPLSIEARTNIESSKIDITWTWKDILMTQLAWKDENWNIKIFSKKINDIFSLPSPTEIMNSQPDINLETIFKEKKTPQDIKNSIDEAIKKNFDKLLEKPTADFSNQRLEMSREANWQAMLDKIISISSPPEARQNYLNWVSLNEQDKIFRPMIEKFELARKNMNINETRQTMQIFSNPKFQNFVKDTIWADWKPKQTFDLFSDLKIFDIEEWKFDIKKLKDFSNALSMPDLIQFNRKLLESDIDLKKIGYEYSSNWDNFFLKDTWKRRPTIEDEYLNVLYWNTQNQ